MDEIESQIRVERASLIVLKILRELSDSERIEVLSEVNFEFCSYCGIEQIDSDCQCWNDE